MAVQKTTLIKKNNSTFIGSESADVIDVISVYGTGNTIKARNGNDQVTVYAGSNHIIYGETGADKITVGKNTGTGIKVYGGAGKDTISINGSNSNYYYGGDDTDTIIAYGGSKNVIHGNAGSDKITIGANTGTGNKIYGDAGDDSIRVNGGTNSFYYGGNDNDTVAVYGGTAITLEGGAGVDTIRINGGSGHMIQSGAGNDKVYINGGSFKSIANSGGNDYIEIGKNTVNGVKINWGNNGNYNLVANETVKVLGGSNHDIRLYGGNDKVIVAGGSGHVIYTDGPTGSGDAGGNDTIVIQSGGRAKKIVAGDGNDVIAIANGAGNGSTIYTGVENPSNVNTGKGTNTVNVLGGSGHTLYLGGTGNKVLIEAQNVTLNKYAGTADDIRVRWSEQGTGTLRINCPSVSSSKKSTLRLEGVKSYQFAFYKQNVDIKNANGVVSETVNALVMRFVGYYERDTRTVSGSYQWAGDNEGNTRLPVYVNGNGLVQYNWCNGNQQTSYNTTPVATGGSIEITRWNTASLRVFDTIVFDDKSVGYNDIITATGRDNHSLYAG
jgi:hypothetical protein